MLKQRIVGAAELQAREQRLAEHIAAEGAGLAHQRVDDVSVVDLVLPAADDAVHHRDALAPVVQFHDVGV